jgi:ubiquinone/menaquinone biosynthesis C-methylase UbiE
LVGPGDGPESYRSAWEPESLADALRLIYNTESLESFEEGGQIDARRLEPWLGPSVVALDLGCGLGRVAKPVSARCETLWAVDVSQRMLDLAGEYMQDRRNVRYARCDEVRVPMVPSASVDLAYSFLVLQHVEKEDAFLLLEELRRVIKPDGVLCLTFPNLLSDVYLDSFVNYAHAGQSNHRPRARMYTPEEVLRILPAAGFEAEVTAETELRVVATPC